MSNLVLERKAQQPSPVLGNEHVAIAITPPLDEDFWSYRVKVSDRQAVVGFPKFFTIGIGFAEEEDWNTNFPYTCDADEIFEHIKHNKGDESIADEDVREAIRLIQAAIAEDGGPS